MPRRLCRSLCRPLQDLADLVILAPPDDRSDLVQIAGRHHHQDLVDQRRLLHRGDGVFYDRLAGDLDQLLGDIQTDACAGATAKYNSHVP